MLRLRQIREGHVDLKPGFYWTLDEGDDAQCRWSGPFPDEDGAKVAAINSIATGYAKAVRDTLGLN